MGPSGVITLSSGLLELLFNGGAALVAVISFVMVVRYRRLMLDRSISKEDEARVRSIETKVEKLESTIASVPGLRELHDIERSTERMDGKLQRFDARLDGLEDKMDIIMKQGDRIHDFLLEKDKK